ncbi:hypothetical protein ACWC2K_23105 [Streptomyces chattanoogensis]
MEGKTPRPVRAGLLHRQLRSVVRLVVDVLQGHTGFGKVGSGEGVPVGLGGDFVVEAEKVPAEFGLAGFVFVAPAGRGVSSAFVPGAFAGFVVPAVDGGWRLGVFVEEGLEVGGDLGRA